MSWRLWYRETANHHEVDKDYFSFVPAKADRLHYIGSSEPSPALSASSTLTTSSSRSTRQFSPASFIRFISSLSPDHSLNDFLNAQKLKTVTTLSDQTDLEITEAVIPPLAYRDLEKKDKGRDRGEHAFLNADAYEDKAKFTQPLSPVVVITPAADEQTTPSEACQRKPKYTSSKRFFIKSDDESEGSPKQHKPNLTRAYQSTPQSKRAIVYKASSVSSLGSDTDYDSDYDDDSYDEDIDEDDLFPNPKHFQTVDSFCKRQPTGQQKQQRSLLSAMFSNRSLGTKLEPRPVPLSTIRQSHDPIMAKELSDSLRKNLIWEQSQKRIGCFKRPTTSSYFTHQNDSNPSLSDDEFQGW
ncbi:hypothetical protein VKS41_004871 [Umbelopsis sp. WA50703]